MHIGGQAVIEGVMIRNQEIYSIAVRKPDGKIEVIRKNINSPSKRIKFLRWPFIRGITALVENLVLGVKSLLYSAEIAIPENEKSSKRKNKKGEEQNKKDSKDAGILFTLGLIPAILLGVVLFIVLPNLTTHYLGIVEKDSPFIFNIIAGGIRLIFFLAYLLVISLLKDIKRTFQYHGAEHKTIFCYEAGKPLIPEEVDKFKTLHPRCGTSFLFFVFFIAIIVFPILTVLLEIIFTGFGDLPLYLRKIYIMLLHIFIALPIIASVSYELIRLSDKLNNSLIMNILTAPGLFLQKITTKEPDNSQLEVAIEAVKAVL